LLAALAITSGACNETAGPHNVLLVTVDTLRPDRLSYAGHPRPTSPALDKLAAQGVVFDNSRSVAGWTLPAIASILTGRYPKDHAATDFRFPIDPSVPTLASILSENRWETQAYVSHFLLNPGNGFARGFSVFDGSMFELGNPHDISSSRRITDLALAGIAEAKEPWFVWAHYFDPHFEYLKQPGYGVFGSDMKSRYDQEIAWTDQHIGRLLDGVSDDTIVIFTADHGEEFGEHGGEYHYTLYREVMLTPLIIRAPFLKPGRDETWAEQIDVLPTVLSMLGLKVDEELPGRDLFDGEAVDGPVFLERDRPPPWRQRGVVLGNLELFVVEERPIEEIPEFNRRPPSKVENVEPGIYMYDLASDPLERVNLYDEDDPRSSELLELLDEHFRTSSGSAKEMNLDEDTLRKLRDLGYIE
jgi:arylsulfatase A-like enzyme